MYCNQPIRRLAVYNYQPGSLHYKVMNVMLNEGTAYDALNPDDTTAWKMDASNYSQVAWRRYERPSNHWVVPMVPGHKYRITWGTGTCLDFDSIRFEVTQYLWGGDNNVAAVLEGDFDIDLPFRDYRESVTVVTEGGTAHVDKSRQNSLPNPAMGGNDFINTSDPGFTNTPNNEKMLKLVVSGDSDDVRYVDVSVNRCIDVDDCDFVTDISYGTSGAGPCGSWSDPSTWSGQFDTERIPIEGDYVRIGLDSCVVLDIDECAMPQLKFLEINGLLKALNLGDGTAMALKAYNIWIRAGELRVGEPGSPHLDKFTIMLLGDSKAHNWAFNGATEVGNKALVVTGLLNLYG